MKQSGKIQRYSPLRSLRCQLVEFLHVQFTLGAQFQAEPLQELGILELD